MAATPVIRPFRLEDEADVIALWRACGLVVPWNDPVKDIRRKLAVQDELFLVAEVDGQVAGATMDAPVSACVRFAVDDLEAAWDRALAAGAREVLAPAAAARGARLALGLDPQGNLFGLRQR